MLEFHSGNFLQFDFCKKMVKAQICQRTLSFEVHENAKSQLDRKIHPVGTGIMVFHDKNDMNKKFWGW